MLRSGVGCRYGVRSSDFDRVDGRSCSLQRMRWTLASSARPGWTGMVSMRTQPHVQQLHACLQSLRDRDADGFGDFRDPRMLTLWDGTPSVPEMLGWLACGETRSLRRLFQLRPLPGLHRKGISGGNQRTRDKTSWRCGRTQAGRLMSRTWQVLTLVWRQKIGAPRCPRPVA